MYSKFFLLLIIGSTLTSIQSRNSTMRAPQLRIMERILTPREKVIIVLEGLLRDKETNTLSLLHRKSHSHQNGFTTQTDIISSYQATVIREVLKKNINGFFISN